MAMMNMHMNVSMTATTMAVMVPANVMMAVATMTVMAVMMLATAMVMAAGVTCANAVSHSSLTSYRANWIMSTSCSCER